MVCLTGDVHQRSYRGTDTPFSRFSEVELAHKYADIAGKYDVPITLFLTGKACLEEVEGVRRLAGLPHCEIGGHTFAAFRDPWSRLYKKILGTPWGKLAHQSRDIARTISSIHQVTGKRILVWRNHAYVHTVDTPRLLEQAGIGCVSDEVNTTKRTADRLRTDLFSLPINVLPDHEHLLHGKYQSGKAKPERLQGRLDAGAWLEQVKNQVQRISQEGGVATILAHPLCMEVVDAMATFEDLCEFLQAFPCCWVSRAISRGARPE